VDWGYVIINAIVLACIYGTLAIGVSITWSSLGLINMSFGFIFSFAGYGAWLTAQHISHSGVVILVSGVLAGALGFYPPARQAQLYDPRHDCDVGY
jgi:branched-chain amino acid transport system permease protein